jgi:polar amino acid transport system substrate-binding protein
VADYNTAFMDLESGACDAVAMDIGVAEYDIKNKNNTDDFSILDQYITTEKYGVGFKKGNTDLKDKVQTTLDEMFKDGTVSKIAKEYGISNDALISK